jgi:hypothetical protein
MQHIAELYSEWDSGTPQVTQEELKGHILRELVYGIKHDCMRKLKPILIRGLAGTGKTVFVHELPELVKQETGMDFNIHAEIGPGTLSTDMMGLPNPKSDSSGNKLSSFMQPDFLPREDRDGKHGILLIDEIEKAQPDTFNMYLNLLQFGTIPANGYKLPDGWLIVCLANFSQERTGSATLPVTIRRRMRHFLMLPSAEEYKAYAERNHWHPAIPFYWNWREESIIEIEDRSAKPTSIARPATWEGVAQELRYDFDINYGQVERANGVLSHIGSGYGHEFNGFLTIYEGLRNQSWQDVLANPETAPIYNGEKEMATLFAMIGQLSLRVTHDTFSNFMTYARRLESAEARTVMIKDAIRRDPTLQELPAYGQYLTDCQHERAA